MKRIFLAPAAALAAALLAGCGGGGGAHAPPPTTKPPAAPAPAMNTAGDSFTAALLALVRSAPEFDEPADVEGVAPALPDGGEPAAVE